MTTLEKVEKEIAEGKLGIARDRLHGLVQAYPLDLSLRSRLGDVYWKLGYPREAGRFWFLANDSGEERLGAIALFFEQCNGDPSVILKRLKLRIHPEDPMADHARTRIDELVRECKERGLPIPPWPPKADPLTKEGGTALVLGCTIVAIMAVLLIVIGLITVISRTFNLDWV